MLIGYARVAIVLTSGYSQVLAEEGAHGFSLHKPHSVEALGRLLREVANAG